MKNRIIYMLVNFLQVLVDRLIDQDDDYQSWCELVEPRLAYAEYKKHSARMAELIAKHGGDYCKAYYAELEEMPHLEDLLA